MFHLFTAGAALLVVGLGPPPPTSRPRQATTVYLEVLDRPRLPTVDAPTVVEADFAKPSSDVPADDARESAANDSGLVEWLVVRLHEDGYAVTGESSRANIDLVVEPGVDGRGWHVSARGASELAFAVEFADDPAVTRLEVLHRSLDALEGVEPRAAPQPARGTFALAIASSAPEALAPAVALGVLSAGGTLVPPPQPADFLVCADQNVQTQSISVISGDGHCADEPTAFELANEVPAGSRTAALVAGALALKESAATADSIGASTAAATSEAEETERSSRGTDSERAPGLEAPVRAHLSFKTAPRVIRVGAAAGVVTRSSGTDSVVSADLTVGREPGFGFWLDVQVRPSLVVGPLVVVETVPAVGPKLRALTTGRFSLDLGLLLGAELHTFRFDRGGGELVVRGTDTSLCLESALGFSARLWKIHEFRALLRFGGGRERMHRVGGVEVWRRGQVHFGATVGLTFGARPLS